MFKKTSLPSKGQALSGTDVPLEINNQHFVHARPLKPPFSERDDELQIVYFGMGCFWGAERKFWVLDGVYTTAVGYGAGVTENPTYKEVCSGQTGHNELVMVVYQPETIQFDELLKIFFEAHDPTQGMRQGNDVGTQYRSMIACTTQEQMQRAKTFKQAYQKKLAEHLYPDITTEVLELDVFYYAEDYHQQYLAKNPNGYCGLGGTGVTCTI